MTDRKKRRNGQKRGRQTPPFHQFPAMKFANIHPPDPNQSLFKYPSEQVVRQKTLVELSSAMLDVNLETECPLEASEADVLDIDWSVQLDSHAIQTEASLLLVNGVLSGNIFYIDTNREECMEQVVIPWKARKTIEFSSLPLPNKPSTKHTYLFKRTNRDEPEVHREQILHHHEPTHCELSVARVSSYEAMLHEDGKTVLQLYVSLELQLHIFQYQPV